MIEKFLHQPLKNFRIFQKFGENQACIEDKSGLNTHKKVVGKVNGACPVGYIELYPKLFLKGHTGLDCQAYRWQPIYSSCDGFVEEVQTEVERGLGIGIITDRKFPCIETGAEEFFKVRYWHLISLNVHKGDLIKAGDLIGYADSTGLSSGDHLHYELKPVKRHSSGPWVNVLQGNGYNGGIDPEPYMSDIFALNLPGINSIIKSLREKMALMFDRFTDFLRYGNR